MIVHSNERKILESNQRLAWLQTSDDKRAAAEYLVDQMRVVNEEKQQMLYDNQNMNQQLQEVSFEYEKLQNEMKDFICFRSGSNDQVVENTQRLVLRVQELEDLVVELKSKQSANDLVELKQLVSLLQVELNKKQEILGALQIQRVNANDLFESNEMH